MIKENIKYVDYNGNERDEDFWFNLTEAEVAELQLSIRGGLATWIESIVKAQSEPEIVDLFKKIIHKAYGEKSNDGRRFMKSEEIAKNFEETEAYSVLFMHLARDAKYAAEFINGLMPKAVEAANQAKNIPAPSIVH